MTKIKDVITGNEVDIAIAKCLYGNNLVFYIPGNWPIRLMATSQKRLDIGRNEGHLGYYGGSKVDDAVSFCLELPYYSKRLDEAWKLVEEISKQAHFYLSNYHSMTSIYPMDENVKWIAVYYKNKDENSLQFLDNEDTPALAICKCFLRFSGIEEI